MPDEPKWKPNPGYRPRDARDEGARVVVRLNNGRVCGEEPVTPVTPAGWSAKTTNWTLDEQYSFAVKDYYVLGG